METIVFFCPDDNEQRTEDIRLTILQAIETAPAKSWWHFVAGEDHTHVASFEIPQGSRTERIRLLSEKVAPLNKVFERPTHTTNGQAGLPAIAGTVAKLRQTSLPCRLAVYADPRYLDPNQEAFTHNDIYATRDGSVDHEASPFTTAIKLPENTVVNWVSPITNYAFDFKHEIGIQHFNGYFIQCLGGRLLRTIEDPAGILNFREPEQQELLVKNFEEPGKYKTSVITVTTNEGGVQTVQFNHVDPVIPPVNGPEALLKAAEEEGFIAVKIDWTSTDETADADLYVSSNGLAGELHHAQKTTDWGQYYKDQRAPGRDTSEDTDYSNTECVKVNHSRLNDLVVWVNIFEAEAPIRLTVTRVWNGERKTRVLDIDAVPGDRGRNINNRNASSAWKRISLYGIGPNDPDNVL